MTPVRFAIHDHITEAIRHLEKARDLIRNQTSYPCLSVDVNAVEVACRMLENLCDVVKDVERSALEHTADSSASATKG